ncbi:MAG: glycosyltransferase family 9 protein [archaeon]
MSNTLPKKFLSFEKLDYFTLENRRKRSYNIPALQLVYKKYSRIDYKKELLLKILKSFLKLFPVQPKCLIPKHKIKKILLIKFGHLGDKLLFESVPRVLKENFPHAEITLLTNSNSLSFLERFCDINRFYIFNHPNFVKFNEKKDSSLKFLRLLFRLRREKYDLVFEFRGQWQASLFALLSAARYKVGYSNALTRPFYNFNVEDNYDEHEIFRNLKLLRALSLSIKHPYPRILLSENNDLFLNNFIRKYKVNSRNNIIGIHIGAGWGPKTYPIDYFIKVINSLAKSNQIIVFYGYEDLNRLNKLKKGITRKVIIPSILSFDEFVTITNLCNMFVGSDSGPIHLSQILNIPTIALFSSGDYIRFGTFRKNSITLRSNLECSPCSIDGISPSPLDDKNCIRSFKVCPILYNIKPFRITELIKNKLKDNNNLRYILKDEK